MRLIAALVALIALIVLSATVAVSPAMAATGATPKLRTFTGTVSAVAKDRKSLRLKRTGKPSVRFALGRSTKVTGGGYTRATLKKGMVVRVTARKGRRGYSAAKVIVKTEDGFQETPSAPMEGIPYDGPGSGEDAEEGGF